MRFTNLIIIHTPLHGYGDTMSSGPAITDGEELVSFQTDVIKALHAQGYVSQKVTLMGYSLGGMTLVRMLADAALGSIVSSAILLNTNYKSIQGEDFFLSLCKNGKYDHSRLTKVVFPPPIAAVISHFPYGRFSCSNAACIADAKCAASFEAETTPQKEIDARTLYIGSLSDRIFPVSGIENALKHFSDVSFQLIPGSHVSYVFRGPMLSLIIQEFLRNGNNKA